MLELFRWNAFQDSEERGVVGEDIVYKNLDKVKGRKAFLPNCYIPIGTKGTTEIDMIFLHESGVYVIESKNYSGWIFGNEEQEQWTQCLRGKCHTTQKYAFYNPLWQNETHIHALMKLLKDDLIPYYSYIVFGNNCELKDIQLTSGNHHVTYARYLQKDIEHNAWCMGNQLSDEKMDDLYAVLVKFTDASEAQKEKHIEEVLAKQYPVVQPDGTWRCPLCGGKLIPRVAKQGARIGQPFWGCSNYPQCHFIYQE